MRLTFEDIGLFSQETTRVEYNANARVGSKLIRIIKTTDHDAFQKAVLRYRKSFPQIEIMLDRTEIEV